VTDAAVSQRQDPWHQALLYANQEQYVRGVLRFVRDALDAERAVFVAVPPAKSALLRESLDGAASRVHFRDMREVGRNPGRMIPAIRAFIDAFPGRPVSFVGEPSRSGRSAGEMSETTRHEALMNAAFEGSGARVMCPYDLARLDSTTLTDAQRTHPELVDSAGARRPSHSYAAPYDVWNGAPVLPAPPPGAERMTITLAKELGRLRDLLQASSWIARLPDDRISDLLVAVTELVTNSLQHGGGTARVTLWSELGRLWCDVQDSGRVLDPLVGRRAPEPDAVAGRGLWLVNHLCDLVQLHSAKHGTTVRITVER
jgi:anti-sigma regulatory factor (Ser/Thr protein kinase)